MAEKFAKVCSYCSWRAYFIYLALCLYVGVEQLWWDEPGPQVTEPAECVHSFHPRPLMAFIPCTNWRKKTLSLPLSFQIFLFNTRFARFFGFFLFFFTPQYANLSWSIKLQLLPSWIGDRDFNSCAQIEFLQREQAQEIVSIRGKRWIKAIKLDTNGPMRMMMPDLTH